MSGSIRELYGTTPKQGMVGAISKADHLQSTSKLHCKKLASHINLLKKMSGFSRISCGCLGIVLGALITKNTLESKINKYFSKNISA